MNESYLTDLALIKVMSSRLAFARYINFIDLDLVEPQIKHILLSINKYFEEFKEVKEVNYDEFPVFFYHVCYPDLSKSELVFYKEIFKKINSLKVGIIDKVLEKFQENITKQKLYTLLDTEYNSDKIINIVEDHKKLVETIQDTEDENVVLNDLDKILEESQDQFGLKWRLPFLNNTIGPLIKGKFIIIAAYVDVGKTAFAVNEATYMARQLSEGNILWLNNEEDDYRVYKKLWKSTLGCSEKYLITNKEDVKREYTERMHGDINRIKLINIRSQSIADIRKLFEKYNPKMVVIDQVDKITNRYHKSFSDHDRLKNLYGEVRQLANNFCPILAISQADATTIYYNIKTKEMQYSLYPHHKQLDGSKVGKPGEADAIIMIGRRADSPYTRGIHVSKNKFGNTIKKEVCFDGERCRYKV